MKCPKCGAEIADDSKFCEFCGTKTGKQNRKLQYFLIGAAIVIAGAVLLFSQKGQANYEEVNVEEIDTTALMVEEEYPLDVEELAQEVVEEEIVATSVEAAKKKESAKEDVSNIPTAQAEKPAKTSTANTQTSSKKQVDDEESSTPPARESIRDLSDVLSKTKITFKENDDNPIITDYNDNINRTVEILKNNPRLKLQVEGYAPNNGSEESIRDLSQRRANKVRDIFLKNGVSPSQISTVSYTIDDERGTEHCNVAIFRIVIN